MNLKNMHVCIRTCVALMKRHLTGHTEYKVFRPATVHDHFSPQGHAMPTAPHTD